MAGFLRPIPRFSNPSGDGLNLVLGGYLYYDANDGTHWRLFPSATTDGPSIPQALQSLIKATGASFLPGVLHDGLWRGYAEKQLPDGSWQRSIPDYETSTLLFREALLNQGMNPIEAEVLYLAVMKFGGDARLDDMALPIPAMPT